ncbi:unnamed protein product [Chironomus riparius]|uniref:SRR1-like domain-containing protein n=1 Tax=Chironomus riparius TaxID=315576 RepID=A0A9N9RSP3_9DIPT|nr:unnamed protein product [Chironomus riparius]
MSDGFILVTKSKRSNKKSRKFKNINIVQQSSDDFNLDKAIKQLENIKFDLQTSDFCAKALIQLEEVINQQSVKEIICLGIGKISEDIIARHQLELIAIIKEKFQIESIKFYDPVFDQNDKLLLDSFKFEVLLENKEGKYRVEHPTIFYLPHCPKQITNNLLYSNWNFEELKNLILICNSFKSIKEATPERFLRPNAHFLLEISSFTKELEISNTFKFSDIFNDFSIHSFPSKTLPDQSSNFWTDQPKPNYSLEDLELVKA